MSAKKVPMEKTIARMSNQVNDISFGRASTLSNAKDPRSEEETEETLGLLAEAEVPTDVEVGGGGGVIDMSLLFLLFVGDIA
jgi:hypothetical protein